MTQLDNSIRSWLEGEHVVRRWCEVLGLPPVADIDQQYAILLDPVGSRKGKAAATRALHKMMDKAEHDSMTSGPRPHVLAEEWHWGRPGSDDDLALLAKHDCGDTRSDSH